MQSLPLMLLAGVGLVLAAAKTLQFVQSRLLHRVSSLSLSKFNVVDVCVGILVSGSFMMYFGNVMHPSEPQRGGCIHQCRHQLCAAQVALLILIVGWHYVDRKLNSLCWGPEAPHRMVRHHEQLEDGTF